jgi:hypothetical protein
VHPIGWLVAVQGPKDPKQRLYAAVASGRRTLLLNMKRDTPKLSLAITYQSQTSASNFNDALGIVRLRGLG